MSGAEKSDQNTRGQGEQPERPQKRFSAEERADYRTVLARLATAKLPQRTASIGSLEDKGLLF